MRQALSDQTIDRIIAVASAIALMSGVTLMLERVYLGSMLMDLFSAP